MTEPANKRRARDRHSGADRTAPQPNDRRGSAPTTERPPPESGTSDRSSSERIVIFDVVAR